jgi:type II secretory pathway pseudopilin PulG
MMFRILKLNSPPLPNLWNGRTGSTLIEVMLSCVILVIVAVGGAEYIYRGQATQVVQKNRRLALWVANSRLEEIRATPYGTLTNLLARNYTAVTVLRSNNTFVARSGEKANIGGMQLPMTNTIQYIDAENDNNSFDAIKVTVSVVYRAGGSDPIILQTVESP